jgi:hypothetical protein
MLLQKKHFTSPETPYFSNLSPVERLPWAANLKKKACLGITQENQISLLQSTLGCFTVIAFQIFLQEYLLLFEGNRKGMSFTTNFTKGKRR